jgi:glycosyltransferase involved in cell wall biosynthesis
VLVLVPAFNEQETVARVVSEILASGFPAVVIDDGSHDETASRAAAAGARVLRLPVNLGVGGALRCGFRYAVDQGFDTVVQCDADGQHRPQEIERLLEPLRRGAHLVIGSRFKGKQMTRRGIRHRAMKALTAIAGRAAGVHLTDATSGFRAIRQPLLDLFCVSYPTEYLGDTVEAIMVAGRAGYSVAEVPVDMDDRGAGTSSATTTAASWYVVRVLSAVALRAGRRPSARAVTVRPIPRPAQQRRASEHS